MTNFDMEGGKVKIAVFRVTYILNGPRKGKMVRINISRLLLSASDELSHTQFL